MLDEGEDAGFETSRCVWDAWQCYGLQLTGTPSVISTDVLPRADLPPAMMAFFTRRGVSPIHLVFPSARQAARFSPSDVVAPHLLEPFMIASHPSPRSGRILANPVLVHGLCAYELLLNACLRPNDLDAWLTLGAYINSPAEPAPYPVSLVWTVNVAYGYARPGMVVEHVRTSGDAAYRHFAKLLRPFMRTETSSVVFLAQVMCRSTDDGTPTCVL